MGDGGDRQYSGRVYDPGTGFHDYGARMYWPQIGRFISADSAMGSPGSPMTLNRYSYVLNNPYKYVDPSGKFATWTHLDIVAQANERIQRATGARFSSGDVGIMQRAQEVADSAPYQAPGMQHRHAMTEPQQYRGSARDAHAAFVASQLSDAISLEKGGKHADAMMALGIGAHAVMDEFGAAHGFNEWSYDQLGSQAAHGLVDLLQTMDSEAQRRAASAVQGYLGKFIEGTTPGGMKQWSKQNSTTSKDTIGPR